MYGVRANESRQLATLLEGVRANLVMGVTARVSRSGGRGRPWAQIERARARSGSRSQECGQPTPPEVPCNLAPSVIAERTNRTQEAAGSSPASFRSQRIRWIAEDRLQLRHMVAEIAALAAADWPQPT